MLMMVMVVRATTVVRVMVMAIVMAIVIVMVMVMAISMLCLPSSMPAALACELGYCVRKLDRPV